MTPPRPRKIPDIRLKRAYEDPSGSDGYRVLVDRFWPRGRSKESLHLDEWARELAPDPDLIKWFGHKPERWEEFRRRYSLQLETPEHQERLLALLEAAGDSAITLVYGARNETQNQAIVVGEALRVLARSNR